MSFDLNPKFDMVWLYRSPIPVEGRGVISSFKLFLPAFPRVEERGVRVGTLWREDRLSDQSAQNLRSHGQNLSSTSGEAELVAQ
jgi:hypothetical protein